jgi:septum formation protein
MPVTPPRLILASRSPQRRALLEQLGATFEIVVPDDVDELEQGPPHEVAAENAYRKASAVAGADGRAGAVVLGVDTIVAVGTKIYGKPADVSEARTTLTALSGRRHTVISGVCTIDGGGRPRSAVASTVVEFRAIGAELLDWYLDSEEWRERAGGYAIQGRGAALVQAITGDYTNVVGLPIPTLLELMPDLLQR